MWRSLSLVVALVVTTAGMGRDNEGRPAPAADPKPATSRITNVTVYQNNALVTREVEVPEGKGTMELVVTPLPPQTVNSSLYSEGTEDIRILTTRYRMRPIQEDTREEVRKREAQLKELANALQKLQSDVRA